MILLILAILAIPLTLKMNPKTSNARLVWLFLLLVYAGTSFFGFGFFLLMVAIVVWSVVSVLWKR